MIIRACAFLFAFFPLFTQAAPIDQLKECQPLKDAKKRLSCFDDAAKLVIAFEVARQEQEAAAKESAKLREENERVQKLAEETKRRDDNARTQRTADDATARAALAAVLKLDTRTSTGISYRDYSPVLSEAKLAVRQFQGSNSAMRRPKLAAKLSETIQIYEEVNEVWNVQMVFNAAKEISPDRSPVLGQAIAKYPSVREAVRKNHDWFNFSAVIPLIWKVAGQRLAEAEKLLADEIQ